MAPSQAVPRLALGWAIFLPCSLIWRTALSSVLHWLEDVKHHARTCTLDRSTQLGQHRNRSDTRRSVRRRVLYIFSPPSSIFRISFPLQFTVPSPTFSLVNAPPSDNR
ncbi:hypothetical protein BD311DRAFT_745456 [Dichomitus squalens]|uniref:Uncharacterized protein n=1 Tax=Dichomitus squalens TaxID=114155 RepID=A0A4Q9N3D5_9APHY|nr:hypothetical protein BD311DRAFT_745456 [Dichomitus squalens]